jgi:hypothetical protein
VGLLERQGQVKKIGQNVDPEFGFAIQLTDEGEHRLSIPEQEYRRPPAAPLRENDLIEREILTALRNRRRTTGVRPMISEVLPDTRLIDKDWRDEAWRFERLAGKGMVKTGQARLQRWVQLEPLGEERISMSEEEWLRNVASKTTTLNNIFNAPVHQFAQTSGDHSPIEQSLSMNDFGEALKLIERLVEELRRCDALPGDTKSVVMGQIQEIQEEAAKPKPDIERQKLRLETVKVLVQTAPVLIEAVRHLWPAITHNPCPF